MKPYIFLTENYLKFAQDSNGNPVDIRTISAPISQEIFFTDRYGNVIERTIDTLILQDTNIQTLGLETADGNGNYTTLFSLSNNTDSTVIMKAANAVRTSSIRLSIPSVSNPATITAKIGVYGFLCNLLALTDSNYKIDANEGGYRVLDGSYIHYADYKKWVGKIKMENLTKEQFDLLTAQANFGEMTVIPYQDLEAAAIYECAVNREYGWGLDRKTELFNMEMELNEL